MDKEPIAIIGMSGRFPQASSVDELWALLAQGKSGISEIPRSRWDWRDYFTAIGDSDNQITTNLGGLLTVSICLIRCFLRSPPEKHKKWTPVNDYC